MSETMKENLFSIFQWILGLFYIFMGTLFITTPPFIIGLIELLIGLAILPPVIRTIEKSRDIQINTDIKSLLMVFGFIFLFFLPADTGTLETNENPRLTTQTETEKTSVDKNQKQLIDQHKTVLLFEKKIINNAEAANFALKEMKNVSEEYEKQQATTEEFVDSLKNAKDKCEETGYNYKLIETPDNLSPKNKEKLESCKSELSMGYYLLAGAADDLINYLRDEDLIHLKESMDKSTKADEHIMKGLNYLYEVEVDIGLIDPSE